jgi:hypothetical protein
MSHIYENREETKVDLIAGILSVCVNIQKYARDICPRTQQTLCVNSSITTKSQAAISKARVNYSITLPMKFTIIDVLYKYITNDTKKFKMFSRLVFFTYLTLRCLRNLCSPHKNLEFTSQRKASFTSSTALLSQYE